MKVTVLLAVSISTVDASLVGIPKQHLSSENYRSLYSRDGGNHPVSFIQSGPLAGQADQTFHEASGGIHPSMVCTDLDDWWPDDRFCTFQNESIPVVLNVDLYTNLLTGGKQTHNFGVITHCPGTTQECLSLENNLTIQSCLDQCKGNAYLVMGLGVQCSNEALCDSGLFCQHDFSTVLNQNSQDRGICTACPENRNDCLTDSVGGLTLASKRRCLECFRSCSYKYWGEFAVDGENGRENIMAYALSSLPSSSTVGSVYAPLVDCSDLILDKVEKCPGANSSICLVHDFDIDTVYSDIARECGNSGGVALVLYYQKGPGYSDDVPVDLSTLLSPANIPVVRIAFNEGKRLKETKLGSFANVTTYNADSYCWNDEYCSTTIPCVDKSQYCYFLEGTEEGHACRACPDDPVNCFFPSTVVIDMDVRVPNTIESCSSSCMMDLELETNCKTCGESISAMEFGVDDPSDRCDFCPEEDIVYPDRIIPVFSTDTTNVTCSQVQSFFSKVDVDKDSKNCRLVQLQNYICGCKGPGYAGANTQAKRRALVWMPRVAAILSSLGSLFVMVDVLKTPARRSSLFHQLMAQMSAFDIIGSIAYAFTSLPIPPDYFFEGAYGTEATCTAQGYFIQLGTVACYTNVSLAFYYYCLIHNGWSNTRLKKVRKWFFICPLLVGLAFAFAGIPYYDNMVLWCNNAAPWWPDIPVAAAVLISTFFMLTISFDAYEKSKASKRWQQQGASSSNSLHTKVFWQCFWFLMAFYMTWPPYLALQYSWAAGKQYGNYGFILYAGTVVPLQGAWNCFVYARNRQLKHFNEQLSGAMATAYRSSVRRLSQATLRSSRTRTSMSNTLKSDGAVTGGSRRDENANGQAANVQAAVGIADTAPNHPTIGEGAADANTTEIGSSKHMSSIPEERKTWLAEEGANV